MSGHTPEPWDVRPIEHDKSLILGAPDGFCSDMIGTAHRPDDARRIVAAVNATAGISPEALEAGCIAELVEALEVFAKVTANPAADAQDRVTQWRNASLYARTTLAKVKGETA